MVWRRGVALLFFTAGLRALSPAWAAEAGSETHSKASIAPKVNLTIIVPQCSETILVAV
jgi:hypothetical protein